MRLTMGKKRRARRGAAAVEFAFAAPILFLFVFAIFEFGRAFMVIDLLADAARVGCREGAVLGKSTSGITSDVQSQLQGEGITGATVTVEVNGVVADSSTAKSGDAISVSVSVPAEHRHLDGPQLRVGELVGPMDLGETMNRIKLDRRQRPSTERFDAQHPITKRQ